MARKKVATYIYDIRSKKLHKAWCYDCGCWFGSTIDAPKIVFRNNEEAKKYLKEEGLAYKSCKGCKT